MTQALTRRPRESVCGGVVGVNGSFAKNVHIPTKGFSKKFETVVLRRNCSFSTCASYDDYGIDEQDDNITISQSGSASSIEQYRR